MKAVTDRSFSASLHLHLSIAAAACMGNSGSNGEESAGELGTFGGLERERENWMKKLGNNRESWDECLKAQIDTVGAK